MRRTSKFKTRAAKVQGVPVPYTVEVIGHPRGPYSIYSRGYRTSRGFFKIFFARNLRGQVILGFGHPMDLHFQKSISSTRLHGFYLEKPISSQNYIKLSVNFQIFIECCNYMLLRKMKSIPITDKKFRVRTIIFSLQTPLE